MAASTSKKHRDFVAEPVGNKAVTKMPGVGPAIGIGLEKMGITKASQVVGKYLLMDKDDEGFNDWMRTAGANAGQRTAVTNGVKEYCNNFL